MTEKPLVATAFAAHSAALVARMLRVVGDDRAEDGRDAAYYERLAAHIRAGFRARFVRGDGRMTSDTQCAYALAIALGLLDDAADGSRLRAIAGDRLAELVRERGFVVGTGFAGTPYVLDALCATGHADEAFSLFLSDKCPSWLYQVRMGATTTWERWDSMLPDGNVNPGDMTSFNHYALGSVASWMHDAIGGLRLAAPGWREVVVAPCIGAARAHGLTSGSTAHETSFGRFEASWATDADGATATVDVTVPDGVTAVLGFDAVDHPAGTRLEGGVHRLRVR